MRSARLLAAFFLSSLLAYGLAHWYAAATAPNLWTPPRPRVAGESPPAAR